jgi:hypothetical protein
VSNNQCYSINSTGQCYINNSPQKIVYDSDPIQCVSSCGPNLYEMGNFCYKDCNGGNRELDQASSRKCKCRYLFYKDNQELGK